MKKTGSGIAVLVLAATVGVVFADTATEKIVPAGAQVGKVAGDFKFTEGPAWDYKGALYFSNIPANQIVRLTPEGHKVWRENSGGANGLMFDQKRRLVACEGTARRVSRLAADDRWETVADSYHGKKLNSPNDLAIDVKGRIYFTDPRYGNRDDMEQDKEAVYRIDPGGKIERVVDDTKRCNGIAISPSGKMLYVVDNGAGEMRAYPLNSDGSVGTGKTIARVAGGDGMCVDAEGNLYVACTDGIKILLADGRELGNIKVPEQPANCAFGGKDLRTLYITARTGLYMIRLNARGWQVQLDGIKK